MRKTSNQLRSLLPHTDSPIMLEIEGTSHRFPLDIVKARGEKNSLVLTLTLPTDVIEELDTQALIG